MTTALSSEQIAQIQERLGLSFVNSAWLIRALCHKSFHKENPEQDHNEKLEFLGDAVLDAILSDLLMERFAEDSEGSLSRKRASVVNEERLCRLSKELGLPDFLLIGAREINNNLHENPRIVASVLEAVVGAIYKDQGFSETFLWVQKLFAPILDEAFLEHDFVSDYKTRFQEWAQEEFKQTPRYLVVAQEGPDHSRQFEVEVFVGEISWGRAWGNSKKSAAQNAARQAFAKVEK